MPPCNFDTELFLDDSESERFIDMMDDPSISAQRRGCMGRGLMLKVLKWRRPEPLPANYVRHQSSADLFKHLFTRRTFRWGHLGILHDNSGACIPA
jgi:hypothetical protein